jgi:phospholipid/cholesterol/gamma-HCH transport system substrate-binding protein
MKGRRTFGRQRFKVGALIVAGLFLLGYGVYRVGKIFDVFASRFSVMILLNSVAGLREGAPVTLAGQRVGQVKRIEFIPLEQKRGNANLTVELKISRKVQQQIRRDSRAYLRAQGLLGDKYIDISAGTLRAVVIQEGDTLKSQTTMDIEQFLARSGAVLDSASNAVSDVRRITNGLAQGEGTLGQMLTNEKLYFRMVATTSQLQTALQRFSNPDGTFGRMMNDPALYNRLLAAITRVDSLGNVVLHGNGSIGRLLYSDDLYRSLFSGVSRADSAITGFSGMLNRLSNGEGTLHKLATDARMYDELLRAIVDLQKVLGDMRANPKRYVPDVNLKIF